MTGRSPNFLVTLNGSLLVVAMLFLFVSCGNDDNNNNNNPWAANGPQQCFNPINNQSYTCYPGDPNYPGGFQNPGLNGFPNGFNVQTYDQLRATFNGMAMNTNTSVDSSVVLNTSTFGFNSDILVVKSFSADGNSAQIEVVDNQGYDIDGYTLTKQEVLEDIFGENQNYTSTYQVYPIQICTQSGRFLTGYEIVEFTQSFGGIFQTQGVGSRVIVSPDMPFFANPLYKSEGFSTPRNVINVNRENITIGCGSFGW